MIKNAHPNMHQLEEYFDMGFKLMPSGQVDEYKYYKEKYGVSSKKDFTWVALDSWHDCCKSRRAYRHKSGCKNRKEYKEDYSDLKDL